jgi:glutaredoxin-like protein NrdH
MSFITVYSKAGCVQCTATCRALDQRGIAYNIIDVSKNEESLSFVRGLGYMQVPVVTTKDGQHWAGFQLDRINALAREMVAA